MKKIVRNGTESGDFKGWEVSLKVRKSKRGKPHFTPESQKWRTIVQSQAGMR